MKGTFKACLAAGIILLIASSGFVSAQTKEVAGRTILAVGAHAGDMEIACGALLAKQFRLGDRVILLHLTLGEGGNPRLTTEAYGEQKRREAQSAARELGAELLFGPYRDGEIPNDETARRYVADVIRSVKPDYVITHWKNSIHKDHSNTHSIVVDAVLLASLAGVKTEYPAYREVRRVYYTENWEDKEGFSPFTYVDVSQDLETWEKSVKQYEFIRGGISSFPYFDYYRSLARVRGAESNFTGAVAFDVDPLGKKQVLQSLP
jgi:LmbE family N-acetylglucosaminyl deacetylase